MEWITRWPWFLWRVGRVEEGAVEKGAVVIHEESVIGFGEQRARGTTFCGLPCYFWVVVDSCVAIRAVSRVGESQESGEG